jgi:hypothetical protein
MCLTKAKLLCPREHWPRVQISRKHVYLLFSFFLIKIFVRFRTKNILDPLLSRSRREAPVEGTPKPSLLRPIHQIVPFFQARFFCNV